MIEREGVVISSFLRISNALTTLQKNLERAKSLRARPLNLKNGEVLVMYLFYDNPDGLSAEQLSRVCMLDRSLISRSLRSLSLKRLITCPRVAEGKRRYGSKLIRTEEGRRVGGQNDLARFRGVLRVPAKQLPQEHPDAGAFLPVLQRADHDLHP